VTSTPQRDRRPRRELTLGRRIAFAAIATVLLLGVAELGLRIVGVGPSPDRTTTWFSDHILLPPLWHERTIEHPPLRYMAAGQAHHFHPFTPEKRSDTFRVVVFGGSAAHGYGVLEPASFPHRLEQLLQRAVPDREIQVVNLGTIAWSSQQILWASRQLYEVGDWDLIIVYSGHNELLELASWKSYMRPGEHRRYTRVLLLNQRLKGLRIYRVVRWVLGKDEPPAIPSQQRDDEPTPPLDPDVVVGGHEEDADLHPDIDPVAITPAMRLDGMNPVPREERARVGPMEWRYAARTYTHNVGQVVRLARKQGTPVIVMNPAPNDSHDPAWFPYAGEAGEAFESALLQAELDRGNDKAVPSAQAALDLQPDDPRAHYMMAMALDARGEHEDAVEHFIEARARAEYPNRVVPAVSDAIRAFEGRRGVLGVIDVEAMFRSMDPHGFIGYDLVYDHCHPSPPGNWLIATEVARLVLDEGLLTATGEPPLEEWGRTGWQEMRERRVANPRLGEWSGLRWEKDETHYIADFQGDWRAIVQRTEDAVARDDHSAMDWLWAGNAAFYDYRLDAALEAWERALRLDMDFCLAYANTAHALRLVGARAQALGAAENAVECDPTDVLFRAERDLLRVLEK
jgi:tetratricopeptide (TPR) repeat protein